MSQSLRLTIVFEPDEDGWIVASVPEVPGALSQGRTREEVGDVSLARPPVACGMERVDGLGVVDAAQRHRRGAQVGVSELALAHASTR